MGTRLIGNRIAWIAFLTSLVGCSQHEPEFSVDRDYTGNEATYALSSASVYNMSGTVTFRERTDNSTDVIIALEGNTGTSARFPVHLHMGDVAADDAAVAALLYPVTDETGRSETNLRQLADESTITFAELIKLNACVKIHLSTTGEARNIILAAGNIGSAVSKTNSSGRLAVGICKSE